MSRATQLNPFFRQLEEAIASYGGQFNAHLHLDRAGTLDDRYFEDAQVVLSQSNHISLHKKHALIGNVHAGPAYDLPDLEARVRETLDTMVELGTQSAHTMVDVTADRVQLSALELMLKLKEDYAGKIDLQAASYTPLGFNDDQPERWEIFEKGVAIADFIGALPEADDQIDYPENIGFEEHCRRVLELAKKHQKMVHFHTDQRNDERENGTEQVIQAVKQYGAPKAPDREPLLWMIHMISPSTYSEERFQQMAADLANLNLGVICCPSAAIGMRQLRSINGPTYNSIPRVLELLAAGVRVRIASDNISDICSPSTTADLMDEVLVLSAALRFYHIDILARLAAGIDITEEQRDLIKDHLHQNNAEIERVIARYNV